MTLSKFFSYIGAVGYVLASIDVAYAWWHGLPPGWYVLPAVALACARAAVYTWNLD